MADEKTYDDPETHPIIKAARHIIVVHEHSLAQLAHGLRLTRRENKNGEDFETDVTDEYVKAARENISDAHALIGRVTAELRMHGGKLPPLPEEGIVADATAADMGHPEHLLKVH